jgi:hypothetical protein
LCPSSTVVEYSTYNLKITGSNLASDTVRERNLANG